MVSRSHSPLRFSVSGDHWNGSPKFIVLVDRRQVGGTLTTNAIRERGEWEEIGIDASLIADPSKVELRFLNDAWGGSPATDLNLYADRLIWGDGVFEGGAAWNSARATFGPPAGFYRGDALTFDMKPPVDPDSLLLRVSGDHWQGAPTFIIHVDGRLVGDVTTTSAVHGRVECQSIDLEGEFTPDPSEVTLTFVNDAWGGSAPADRNLHVESLSLNGRETLVEDATNTAGTLVGETAGLFRSGSLTFDLDQPHRPDTLTLKEVGVHCQIAPRFTVSVAGDTTDHSPRIANFGVNLAGGSFGRDTGGSEKPGAPIGVYGYDYLYPNIEEIDYFASKGMDTIRLSFLWERVQSEVFAPLRATELARLDPLIDYATSKGMTIILDMHNYGVGFGHKIGTATTTNAAFADSWAKIAAHYADNPNVMFGLMNEPHKHSATEWLASANEAIQAIRGTGAAQKILVPGTYWGGAWTWVSSDNDTVIGAGVRDPLDNFAFDVHQYLDLESSSFDPEVVSETIGVERLAAITEWAKNGDHDLYLTEFGVPGDPTGLRALDNMLRFMQDNADVWKGATYWAAGPWWGDYIYSVEPIGLGTQHVIDRPQMAVLTTYSDLLT